jgi:putative endonuclease
MRCAARGPARGGRALRAPKRLFYLSCVRIFSHVQQLSPFAGFLRHANQPAQASASQEQHRRMSTIPLYTPAAYQAVGVICLPATPPYAKKWARRRIGCCSDRAVAQLGRALRSGRRGRGFESRQPEIVYIYVLRSGKTGKRYVGITADHERRLAEHNAGQTLSKRSGAPWRIVYSERHDSRSAAVLRERFLKSGRGRGFLNELEARLPERSP